MDYQSLRNIFAQTISPDATKRRQAEVTLSALESQQGFILSLPSTLMKDEDPIVRKVAAVFFKNSVQKNWDSNEFKRHVIVNIVQQMVVAEKAFIVYYKEIIRFIFDKEKIDKFGVILSRIPEYMISKNLEENHVAITILLLIQDNDILRYNKNEIHSMMEYSGPPMVDKFILYIKEKNYFLARLIMKCIAKMSKQYSMPPFFQKPDVYITLFETSREILNLPNDSEDLCKLKKWSLRFLHKATHKAFKKFHKEVEITSFITQNDVLVNVYNSCRNIVYLGNLEQIDDEKVIIGAVEYILLLLDEKEYFTLIVNDVSFYLHSLILKTHVFTDSDEIDFNDFPDSYLRQRYNYYSNDLRTVSGSFFTSLVKKLKKYPNYFENIFTCLMTPIIRAKENPTRENAFVCYGSLSLLSLISDHIAVMKKGEVGDFLLDYVFPFLNSEHVFLQAQACYTMQFFDGNLVKNDIVFSVLKKIYDFMKSDCEVLKVDAAHSVTFFFQSDIVQPQFKQLVPEIIQTLIGLNSKYHLESLSDILENIVNNYPDEVSQFAPKLVEALSALITHHLTDYNEDKLMMIVGHLRTISGMMATNTNPDVLKEMFKRSFDLLVFIFKIGKSDFYQESIDIMTNYLYNLKFVDESMWFLFKLVLNAGKDDLSSNVDELTNLIDNYISFGKANVLNEDVFMLIMKFVEDLCLTDRDGFFDDDHNCGCKIMESLLLNNGTLLSDKLDLFIGYAIYNKSLFEQNSSTWVYSLNVIMHCFIVNPHKTISSLQNRGFYGEFFDELYANVRIFGRVHDKKTIMLFIGVLCGQPCLDIDYRKLSKVLTVTLKTLPDAINKRNLEKSREDRSESEYSTDDEESFSNYSDDMLDEDIYFETALDNFDPFPYIANILGRPAPNSVGEKLVSSLDDSQRVSIHKILSTEQPKQI